LAYLSQVSEKNKKKVLLDRDQVVVNVYSSFIGFRFLLVQVKLVFLQQSKQNEKNKKSILEAEKHF
jgi:hypothetical protein